MYLYHVPPDSRYGPWQRRPWALWAHQDGIPRMETVPADEILCQVTLMSGALDMQSLTRLAQLGIDVGTLPRRDHSLPRART